MAAECPSVKLKNTSGFFLEERQNGLVDFLSIGITESPMHFAEIALAID